MIQISQYLFVSHLLMFSSIEHTFFTYFFRDEKKIYHRDRTLFFIYRTVFFTEDFKKLTNSSKNIFFLRLYFMWQKSYELNLKKLEAKNPTIKINKRLYNVFDSACYKLFKFCNNFLFNFFLNNMKLLVLDYDYKNFFFFIKNNFNINNSSNDLGFFFPNVKNFSKKNWLFFFSKFCNNNNIAALFVSDSVLIGRNITSIMDLGLPLISFLVHKGDEPVDYSFFFRVTGNPYYYMLSSFFLNYAFFISFNHRLHCFKVIYIKTVGRVVDNLTSYHYYGN